MYFEPEYKELTYNRNVKDNKMVFVGNWYEEKALNETQENKNSFQRTMIRN